MVPFDLALEQPRAVLLAKLHHLVRERRRSSRTLLFAGEIRSATRHQEEQAACPIGEDRGESCEMLACGPAGAGARASMGQIASRPVRAASRRAPLHPLYLRLARRARGCGMRIGVPTEIKSHEYRVGMTPSGVRELSRAGHTVVGPGGRRRRRRHRRCRVRRGGRPHRARRRSPVRVVRPDRQGQGAAARRVRATPRGPDPLHLPPPRRRPAPGPRAAEVRRDGDRLRDRRRPRRLAPAADADERGRRADGDPGRRPLPRARRRRPRNPVRRGSGRRARRGS